MSAPTPISYNVLPLEAKIRLEQVCQEFEAAWNNGQTPEILPFVADVSKAERLAFVRELILLDMEYRRSKGFPDHLEHYVTQFPELDRAWLRNAAADNDKTALFTPKAGGAGKPQEGCLAAGTVVSDEYEILEQIGRGGMGVVYKARQAALNRLVVIKMILAGEHAGESARQRFRVEAEAAARLEHEGIVRVYGFGSQAGLPYLVMEFVEGGSLKDRMDGVPWPSRQAGWLVERLARIIQSAHEKHIVHRDLKPANVLLTPQDQVKITDFGLARLLDESSALTQTGEVLGTPSYMAPEQARGLSKGAAEAVDVYALGAILYELLTGRPPFRGTTTGDTLLQVMADKPVPPRLLNSKIERDLETVCLKCLEKDPDQRYASAAALADDLARFRENRSILARPAAWTDILLRGLGQRRWVARTIWGRIALALGVVSLLFNCAVYVLLQTQQPKEVWWISVGLFWLLSAYIVVYYLRPRFHALTPAERHVLAIWGGLTLATMSLWVAIDMPYDERLLTTFYPAVAVMMGSGYFVEGSIYWGRFYLLGLAFFALAIVMHFTPEWAPLEMAVFSGGSLAVIGWQLLRTEDE